MLTHGMDGKHKAKVHRIVRGAGYSIKRSKGGSAYSEAHKDVEQDKRLIQEAVSEHESHDHPGTKHTKLKLKSGGIAAGEKSHARLDKKPRLAKGGKAHTKINILVAPGHSSAPPAPVGGAIPPMGGAPIGAPTLPQRPPVGPGAAPPMMGPGMRPQAVKRGGKIAHYEAGAGSGVGREEKVANYKKSVKKYG